MSTLLSLLRFQADWQSLQALGDASGTHQQLLDAYAEPHRCYHTQQHLAECLQWLEQLREQLQRPAELAMALWFHDAVYELRCSDNEQRSADWACMALQAAGVGAESRQRIAGLILATKHQHLPTTADEQCLVDIDLSILGATEQRFAEYERQIRSEYSFVPDAMFRQKRHEILQSFLDREPLFSTAYFRSRLEEQARLNLQAALRG